MMLLLCLIVLVMGIQDLLPSVSSTLQERVVHSHKRAQCTHSECIEIRSFPSSICLPRKVELSQENQAIQYEWKKKELRPDHIN